MSKDPATPELAINPQQRQTASEHRPMDNPRPAGQVHYLPGGGFYVQACNLTADVCPRVCIPPAAPHGRDGSTSSVLKDVVDAIDTDDGGSVNGRSSGDSSVLNARVSTGSDNDVEPVGVSNCRSAPTSNLLDVLDAIGSDDEELLDAQRSAPGAALDLCTTVYHTGTDDSSFSKEEVEDDAAFESEGREDESDNEHQVRQRTASSSVPRPVSSSWESDDLSVDQVDHIIRSDMAEIEAKKPWRFVFRCLNVPFNFKRNEDPFDVFFMRWDAFWRAHGRAVWERGFWQPLLPGSTEYHRRKNRQSRAQHAFRELATDLAERLGKRYRRWLGKALREGWWYRAEPFALRRLFLKDRSLYEEYLVRQVKVRWPRGKKFLLERGLKPMWWLSESANSDNDL